MARRDEPFAIFLFGMRLNRLRGLPRFLWGLRVLRRILGDLDTHPERGFHGVGERSPLGQPLGLDHRFQQPRRQGQPGQPEGGASVLLAVPA
jgi:hypothetical protein